MKAGIKDSTDVGFPPFSNNQVNNLFIFIQSKQITIDIDITGQFQGWCLKLLINTEYSQ